MAAPYAFVTLLTSDSYLPGALALAGAINDIHPSPPTPPEVDFQTVCLVTPETVDVSTIKLLRRAFNVVIGVETIGQDNEKGLQLLGRPDLKAVLTKLHIFRLTQYSKIIFLDADVLPIRPLSHLFTLPHEFSAVPDVGWPDIFNSGMMVLSPGEDKFNQLSDLLKSKGSWDGGDQGILNEWRGQNWNRLSFTYNTTPTAAYTYAPAYERYGSQISAIHFIGPNKPWDSISYRAPGTTSAQLPDESNQERAYDYDSLVDSWYSVYDRHYRSQVIVPESEFEVQRYVSAWNEQSGTGAELASAPLDSARPGGALGLDDLKRLAVEGSSTAGFFNMDVTGEGDYKSMPLEGRLDLMPPKKDKVTVPSGTEQEVIITPTDQDSTLPGTDPEVRLPEPDQEVRPPEPDQETMPLQVSKEAQTREEPPSTPVNVSTRLLPPETPTRMETLPTPGPDEVPSAPYLGGRSLPPTPTPLPALRHRAQPPQTQQPLLLPQTQLQPHRQPQIQSQSQQSQPQQSQPQPSPKQRPPSPPMLVWNPAIEPPPTSAPDPSAFPSDTYFPNVWDQSHHEDAHPQATPYEPDAFFQAPPPSEIPEQLLRQGHYRNVTGEETLGSTPSPDRSKVKTVFPWENKPRHLPGRIFPITDSPPPGSIFIQASPPPLSTPERQVNRPSPVPSPLFGLPSTLIYANAWDTVPSIQKYASRLARPPQPSPLQPAFEGGSRYRSWDERTDASSRDGDDEDEGDDDDDEVAQGDGGGDNDPAVKPRSRSSSISSSYLIKRGKREYRVRGVQTVTREMRSQGVQVTDIPPKATNLLETDAQDIKTSGAKRPRPPVFGANVLYPPQGPEVAGSPPPVTGQPATAVRTVPPAGNKDLSGARSPRDFSYSQVHSPTQTPDQQAQLTTPPKKPAIETSAAIRKLSNDNDNSSGGSPPSSVGPVSPPEGQPLVTSSPRKGGRVWDPARGVDLFKRGSEEVLARFLKMGTWEDEGPSAHV